jgi:hypothetical protein
MILVDGVPLLKANLFRTSSTLGGNKLLQVAYCIIRIALNSDFSAEPI